MGRRVLFGLLVGVLALTSMWPVRAQAQDDPPDYRALFQAIEKGRDSHIAFLQALIRAQPRGEKAVQAVVADRFHELGLEVETLRLLPTQLSLDLEFAADETIDMTERISVIGRLPGSGSGRSMLFFGHPDPEPITDESLAGWEHDPFGGEVEGGRIYGWGVADDLAGVAIMAEAASATP
jgi:acetylornithine deacetylase/succinyl-diaminopimelate desuccinylase-like protein